MIDFRYHIVSLASVLIALSIGIVLGAGPLNDDIGNTLTGEVTKLRQEKTDLRDQVRDLERGATGRDEFDAAFADQLVSGRLDDRRVAVVALPQADNAVTEALVSTLRAAGGTVDGVVQVNDGWADLGDQSVQARAESGEAAAEQLGISPQLEGSQQRVDAVLATVLSGRTGAGSATVDDTARQEAWTTLRSAGLVSGADDVPATATLVVVVGNPVTGDPAEGEDTDPRAESVATSWVNLAAVADRHSDGTVLVGTSTTNAGSADVSPVALARTKNSLSQGISTVDVPGIPMGRVDVVLALQEQQRDDSGHYGLAADADSAVPEQP